MSLVFCFAAFRRRPEKAAAHPEDDGRGQDEKEIEQRLTRDRGQEGKPVLHGAHEDEDAEDRPDDELQFEFAVLPLAGRFGGVRDPFIDHSQELVPCIGNLLP